MPDFDGDSQPPEEPPAEDWEFEGFWSAADLAAAEEPFDDDFEGDDSDDFVMSETAEMGMPEVEPNSAELTVEEAAAAVLETAEIEDPQVMELEAMSKGAAECTRPVARPLTGEFNGAYSQQVAVIESDDEQALGSGSDSVPLQSTSEIVADKHLSREEKIEKLKGLLSQLQALQDRASASAEEVVSTVAEVRESLSL